MDERIVSFLQQSTVLTLATSRNNIPSCANCFYSFDKQDHCLVFKSKRETIHIQQALENHVVSGTVLPDKLDLGKICGLQFNGTFVAPENEFLEALKKNYYKKYPFAFAFSGEIWAIELTRVKMNDNTLGFGKKLEWDKNSVLSA